MENMMYAISIVSTVGWGVYHPHRHSVTSKVVTILYAMMGLPLFTALLKYAHEGVLALERRVMRKTWVQQKIGSTKLLGLVATATLTIFVVLYGAVCWHLQLEEHESDYEELLVQLYAGSAVRDYSWSILTGVYYAFTTLSCIGFGDVYIWDPHPFVWFFKPICLFVITTLVIALLAHAFQSAKKKVEKSFDAFARAHIQNNIAKKSVKYDAEARTRKSSRVNFHFGTKGVNG